MISYFKLLLYEEKIYSIFDDVVYVSFDDKKSFLNEHRKYKGSITVIPLGLEMDAYMQDDSLSLGNSLLFTGNMNYLPNRQAVKWFYENVYSRLKKIDGSIKLHVAGMDADKFLSFDEQDVSIHTFSPIPYSLH